MKTVELAELLGISRQMLYKLIRKDMPADSVASAKLWGRRNLEPYRTVTFRAEATRERSVVQTYADIFEVWT